MPDRRDVRGFLQSAFLRIGLVCPTFSAAVEPLFIGFVIWRLAGASQTHE
jgi:hypothetical protein